MKRSWRIVKRYVLLFFEKLIYEMFSEIRFNFLILIELFLIMLEIKFSFIRVNLKIKEFHFENLFNIDLFILLIITKNFNFFIIFI